jgi:SAM-dependent methyltransferase
MLGSVEGKKILEYGCGQGLYSVNFALLGAQVYAFDISEGMVRIAKMIAQINGVTARVAVVDGEKLAYCDEIFDLIWGTAILHHLNLDKAAYEIHRILKKQGVAIFVEPLGHNPLINLYRFFTPKKRTPSEKPLTFQDIQTLEGYFSEVSHYEFQLFGGIATALSIIFRTKSFIRSKVLNNFLSKVDDAIFRFFPFTRRFCRITVIRLIK